MKEITYFNLTFLILEVGYELFKNIIVIYIFLKISWWIILDNLFINSWK